MHKVAIVILNWNGQSMLAQYLPSVMRHSRNDAAVYVADNASTDNSLAYLAQHFPHCQTIALEKICRRLQQSFGTNRCRILRVAQFRC